MKLEVRKYYRTRDGRKVKIITKDSHDTYPFNGDNGHTYTECGNLYWRGTPHGLDIIAEWTDTPEVGTLKEIGAQVGDVVTINNTEEYAFRIESVSGYRAYGKARHGGREYNDDWSVVATNTWRIVSRASQAPTGPVRTVTTRKVVNQVVIGHVEVTKNGKIWMRHVDTADELTAAIATLTEIRDALAE